MRTTIDTQAGTVTLTATQEELRSWKTWQLYPLQAWATPGADGLIRAVYVATHQRSREDFVLATVEDFEDAVGYDIAFPDGNEHADVPEDDPVTITRPTRHGG